MERNDLKQLFQVLSQEATIKFKKAVLENLEAFNDFNVDWQRHSGFPFLKTTSREYYLQKDFEKTIEHYVRYILIYHVLSGLLLSKESEYNIEFAQLQEVSALAQVEADKKNKEAASAEKKAAQARAKLDDVAPLLKGMEKLAADFSDDPERTLPEAGPLESAKSYREKKAKPLWEKIVKVLRSVYRAYFDLKSKFERLQSAYDREVSKNGSLSARIYEVCAERDGLKGQVRDYERVRRAIGPEQADRILEAAYQQEQVEKEQKWGARSKIRVGAR